MTPQEQQLLTQLTQRINQTQLQDKDPDAQNLLGKELGANPDAMYILAQTALVQDMALQRANSHIADLEKQLQDDEQQIDQLEQAQQRQQPARATSFLGRIFGDPVPQAPPPQAQYQPVSQPPQSGPAYQPVQYAPQQSQYAQPQYVQAQPQYIPPGPMGAPMMGGPAVMGGQPSFLRSAMQTAAGVAAGSLAFEGIESLLHGGFGHPGFGGGYGGFGGGLGGERPVEEVVNNYYGDSPEQERHEFGGEEHHHEEGGERFQNADYQTSGNDQGNELNYDDSNSFEDNSANDSSFDDSGSNDDNSSSF